MNPIFFAMLRNWWVPFMAMMALPIPSAAPPKPLERDEPEN